MAHPRQIGKEGSKTRHRLLDAVEDLMVEDGHAAVTYRSVAARAGVVASNVQYYFPSLDDLLVAAVRRRTEQSLEHLVDMLNARPDQPLRVLWEFGNDETTAALAFEFSALGNHHASVRAETVKYMNRLRGIQLGALSGKHAEDDDGSPAIPAAALIFLLTGIPKLIRMEADFEVDIGHRETVDLVERSSTPTSPADSLSSKPRPPTSPPNRSASAHQRAAGVSMLSGRAYETSFRSRVPLM